MDYHDAIENAKAYSRRKGRTYAVIENKWGTGYYLNVRHRLKNKAYKHCVAVVPPSWVIMELKLEDE